MASKYRDTESVRDTPLNLPMIADRRTEMYVKFAKVMVIFQGPVTNNRQSLVEALEKQYKYSCRVISDKTYNTETCFSFNKENTEDFYRYFKNRVKQTCEDGFNLIVIDQSMSNSSQIRYFLFLAQTFQYVVLPVPALVTERSLATGKPNSNQASSFSRDARITFPNYFNHRLCGWFLHDIDSAELREEANLYARDCFDIPEFDDMFSRSCKPHSFKNHYQMEDMRQDPAFCVLKICKTQMDVIEYMSKPVFHKYYSAMSKLYIVGFIISPHIVAARVKLTFDQKNLWMMADDLPEKFEPKVYLSDIIKETKVSIVGEEVSLLASKSNRTLIAGNPISDPDKAIPHNAKGRSCHFLLGKVRGAPKRNVDYDVPFAVFRERTVVSDPKYCDNVKPYDSSRCMIRRIGKYWFVYLKETIVVSGLFATCCSAESNIV